MAKKDVKAEPEASEVTIEQLVAVAEDFNTFMFTEGEEGINLDLEYDDLLKEVTELAQDLVDTDTVEAETVATLEALEIACPAIVANGAEPVGPETDGDNEESAAQLAADIAVIKKSSKIEKVKEIAKLYKISVPPPFLKDLAKLKAYVIGKLDGSSPAKPKAEKAAKDPKAPKVRAERDGGIGGLVRGIMTESKASWLRTDEDILQEVKAKFPDGNTNMQNIVWYRYQLKNKGLIPVK